MMRIIRSDIATPLYAKSLGIRADRDDVVFVAGGEEPDAYLVARPMMFVHQFDFLTPKLPPSAKVAIGRVLTAYAQGWAADRPVVTSGCLFRVEAGNGTMEEFARTLGGEVDPGASIFRIDKA